MRLPSRARLPILPLLPVIAFLVIAALFQLERVRIPLPVTAAAIDGAAAPSGDVPGGAAGAAGLRYWSTRGGSDTNRGRVVLGPFSAPRPLAVLVRGYPGADGVRLRLEHVSTGQSVEYRSDDNTGEAWAKLELARPRAWPPGAVQIVAEDEGEGWGAWVAITEPFTAPAWAGWWRGVIPRLAAFSLAGIAVLVPAAAARKWLIRALALPAFFGWILALAAVALGGLAVFWLTFFHPGLGALATALIYAAALAGLAQPSRRRDADLRETCASTDGWGPPVLMVLIGCLYFGVLHLHAVDQRLSRQAATRFGSLPSDNEIPQVFATRLLDGESPKGLFGDWLSSDRPPLLSGWQLLAARPLLAVGRDRDTALQCVGIWFQLLWVPALWAWLRSMHVRPGLVALLIVAVAPNTFLLLNSVYIWPKLGAAAFLLAAVTLWFPADPGEPRSTPRHALGGVLAGLAWMSHGGVAFAGVPIALAALLTLRRGGWRRWLAAAGAFVALAGPWRAYQAFYDPPGNRLLKWHLAGQLDVDERGTGQTLRDAYAARSFTTLVDSRAENLATIFRGPWSDLVPFDETRRDERRTADATYTAFALGWWNLGWPALLVLATIPRWRQRISQPELRGLVIALTWSLATTLVWVALMFVPSSTILHQGSYTTMLVCLPALGLALWRVHPALFGAALLGQLIGFWCVALPGYPASADAPWRGDATALLILAACAAAVAVCTAWRREPDGEVGRPRRGLRSIDSVDHKIMDEAPSSDTPL